MIVGNVHLRDIPLRMSCLMHSTSVLRGAKRGRSALLISNTSTCMRVYVMCDV